MPYLGITELKDADIKRGSGTGDGSTTVFAIGWTPPSEQSLFITINGVTQQDSAYTISGSTLTFAAAPANADAIEWRGIQSAGTVMTPGDGTVGEAKLADGVIGNAKLADNAITNAKMADDAVGVAELSATGTASASTFLRGDNSWATAGGDNTPAFLATSTSQQTVTNDVTTKIEFANSVFDTDSAFDNTTNYRFTVPSGEGGKYSFQVHAVAWNSNNSGMKLAQLYIRINGSSVLEISHDMRNSFGGGIGLSLPFLLNLSASDYVEIYGMMQATGTCKWYSSATYRTAFSGFKLL